MLVTSESGSILTPAQVGDLLVRPVQSLSISALVSTLVPIATKSFRIPLVDGDPAAAWVNEGDEITPSDATLDELDVTPSKVAGLSIISSELARDSTPQAAQVVGDGMARDIARKVDTAFFGSMASPAPAGLEALAGVTTLAAPHAYTDLDPFTAGVAAGLDHGAPLDYWVLAPADLLALELLREFSSSLKPLLTPVPPGGIPGVRVLLAGIPAIASPAVTAGHSWGIPKARSYFVLREDAEVVSDTSPFFTSDRVAIRGTMRIGFGWPDPASIVKVVRAPAP